MSFQGSLEYIARNCLVRKSNGSGGQIPIAIAKSQVHYMFEKNDGLTGIWLTLISVRS